MEYSINTTADYHQQDIKTLGWELTVCNALESPDSPCRKILQYNDSYGHLLYRFMERFIPMARIRNIIEVGGGYGYVMRDFLRNKPDSKITMLDISPVLLHKQRDLLKDDVADYILQDFLNADITWLRQYDLAIFNENLGDFPTVLNISCDMFRDGSNDLPDVLSKIKSYFILYQLKKPDTPYFNFNIGAIEALEKLCFAGITYIFFSEHSCEASAPMILNPYLQIVPTGNPERIILQGHDEYTLKFSYLADVAKYHGYDVTRGPMSDFIEPDFSDRVMTILKSNFTAKDEYEVVRQFIYDLYKYEYLILTKK
ncbi:MAG: hypothetical protein JXA41_04890 [Deltaproteobacteria bacterium]|nr:hypothetical protein [Deltaproteobacteria bacterium]